MTRQTLTIITTAIFLSAAATSQAVVLSSESSVLQLGGTQYWVEDSARNMMIFNSLVSGQTVVLSQEVLSSDASTNVEISGVSFLVSGPGKACDVIYGQGVSLDAGKVTVNTLSSKLVDLEPKILAQGRDGVVLELHDGAMLSGGKLGDFALAGSSVVVPGQTYFARNVDVMKVGAGHTATLKDTEAYAEYAIDMDNATLVLDNAVLRLGAGKDKQTVAEMSVNNVHGDKNTIVVQTGKDAMEKLGLSVRPVVNGTFKGTGRLENVKMQGGALQIGAPNGFGSLTIKDVVVKPNNQQLATWTFNINAAGDFDFAGANNTGGTNFSQLKLEGYGNHGQNVVVDLAYQNGSVDDLANKFTRGATIRLIDMENGSLSGNCLFNSDALPTLEAGLAWYTYELFLTGELVVVDEYLNSLAVGLMDEDPYAISAGNGSGAENGTGSGSGNGAGSGTGSGTSTGTGAGSVAGNGQSSGHSGKVGRSYTRNELQRIAVENQAMDATRIANTMAAASATTSAFGSAAMGHAGDLRRWKHNLWFSGYSSCLDRASTQRRTGYDTNTLGYAVGVDTHVQKYNAVVGAALGASSGTMKPNHGNHYYSAGKIEQDGMQLGLYGRITPARPGSFESGVTVEGFISYGTYDCKSSRFGLKNGDAVVGCWDESAWSMGITVSREYLWKRDIVLTPFAGFEYTTAEMESLREMGYTAFDYTGMEEHANLGLFAGTRAHRAFPLQRGQTLIPYASLTLGLDVYRQYAKVTGSSMAGSVSEEETHPGRCFLQLGFGTEWIMGRRWSAEAGYMLEMREAAIDQQLHVSATRAF